MNSVSTEMERDSIIAYGAASLVRERLFTQSDFYEIWVCDICGNFGNLENRKDPKNDERLPDQFYCLNCEQSEVSIVKIPYACKLLFQELTAMCIQPRIFTKNHID